MTALESLTALPTTVQTASLQKRALYLRTSSLRDFLRLLKMQLQMLVQALTQDSLSRKRWKNFLSAATMTQKLISNLVSVLLLLFICVESPGYTGLFFFRDSKFAQIPYHVINLVALILPLGLVYNYNWQ